MTPEIAELLNTASRDHFFGSIEVKYEFGKPVLIRKTETVKCTSDSRNNRGEINGQKDKTKG